MTSHYDFSIIPTTIKTTYVQYQTAIITGLIAATLFLVTLAWNDLIQEIIAYYFPTTIRQNIMGKLYYALIITIIVMLLQIYIFPHLIETKKVTCT